MAASESLRADLASPGDCSASFLRSVAARGCSVGPQAVFGVCERAQARGYNHASWPRMF